MDEQTANLIRETLAGLSQTAKPMWAEAVKAHQLMVIGDMIACLLGATTAALIARWTMARARATKDGYEELLVVLAVVAMVTAGFFAFFAFATLPNVIAVLASPEGHLVRKALTGSL